jgi:sulfur carrier protein
MKVIVNGKPAELSDGTNVLDLVSSYDLKPDVVIVALNDRVVQPEDWAATIITENDCVELVSLVGGG